jgi:SAM-dependent methyltransferase
MHNSAFRTAKLFFDNYCRQKQELITICELGSQIYRSDVCPYVLRDAAPENSKYVGVDFCAGEGVDLILEDAYKFPFLDNTFDVLVTSSCFEHSEMFWLSFLECIRVLKPNGLLYCNAPSSNMPYHRFPVDCWRFFPDSGQALEKWGKYSGYNLKLLESYIVKPNYQENDAHMSDWVSIFIKDKQYEMQYPNRIMELDNYDLNYNFTNTIWYP